MKMSLRPFFLGRRDFAFFEQDEKKAVKWGKDMKKLLCVLLGLIFCASALAGCANGENSSLSPSPSPETNETENAVYKIGLVQYKEHTALDALREAFMGRLEEWGCDETQVEIDYQNAGGDPAKAVEICGGFVEDEVDMIVAIATPAAQAAISAVAGTDVTVVFTGVSDAGVLGLDQGEAPSSKITGVVSPTPVTELLGLAAQASPIAKLGVLYDPEEPNSQAEVQQVKSYCSEQGIEVVEATVTDEEAVAQSATDLCGKVDAVFTPADNTVIGKAAEVAEAAKAAGVPWYTGSETMVQAGALASMGVTSREMGVQAADMAVRLMKGQNIADVPVYTFSDNKTYVNQTTLKALEKVTFPQETLKGAFVYP